MGVLLPFSGLNLQGTVYAFAQFNGLMLATVLAGLGGLVYWGPKLWGRRPADGPLRLLALVGLLAVALVAVPDVILGFMKQPAGSVSNFDVDGPAGLLNALSAVGYCLMGIVVLAVIALTVRGFRRGDAAGDDPWDGQTLEWATTSPPPDGNFADLPVVTLGRAAARHQARRERHVVNLALPPHRRRARPRMLLRRDGVRVRRHRHALRRACSPSG